MSWKKLQSEGCVEPHRTSKQELELLRAAVQRNLADAAIASLSTDNRFTIAYDAALLACKMAIACSGFRAKGIGAHRTTFIAVKLAMGPTIATTAAYLERCRRKRNDLTYETAGIVSAKDAKDLLAEAQMLAKLVDRWIHDNHATLD